jgi:hypothetical protein
MTGSTVRRGMPLTDLNIFNSQTVTTDSRQACEKKMSAQCRSRQLVGDARLGFVEAELFEPQSQFLVG